MTTSPRPLNIRHAIPEDYETIGKLHASALAPNQLYNTLYEKVDPDVARKWYWIDTAGTEAAKGRDTVLVLEFADTKEIIGVAWVYKYNQDRKPSLRGSAPEGFNVEEDMKLMIPRQEWQNGMLEEFGEFVYMQEMAIAPAYQSQGLGKVLMRHVTALAERERLNLALTAGKGKPDFYAKCGFKKIGAPLMYGPSDSLEGVTKMLWEYKADSSAQS